MTSSAKTMMKIAIPTNTSATAAGRLILRSRRRIAGSNPIASTAAIATRMRMLSTDLSSCST
jgi:hypothetical protein